MVTFKGAGQELADGTLNTMTCDRDGKRRRMEDSDGTHDFVWGQENILCETDNSDTTGGYCLRAPQHLASTTPAAE